MHISEIYRSIYRRFDNLTPLPFDCGALCGKLCCTGEHDSTEESGMYLFPGEEALFCGKAGYRILQTDFCYDVRGKGRHALLVVCTKPCNRVERPLSCRVFPLAPYFREGSSVKLILDPRAAFCPLTHSAARPYINREFAAEALRAFRLLAHFPEIRSFLEGLSDILDDCHTLLGGHHHD